MNQSILYICSCCGKEHQEWPSLAFISPKHYQILSAADKEDMAEIDTDFCIIRYPEQTDRFIRCTLTQKVSDHCEDLDYGLWVSLSEKNFNDYTENFTNDNYEATYFGWLCNDIPEYEFDKSIPTTVYLRGKGMRPEIVPNKDFEHPFVKDYFNGITKQEAERRISNMLNNIEENDKTTEIKRPWWKLW